MKQTLFSKQAFQSLLFGVMMLLYAQLSWGQTIAPAGTYSQNFDGIGVTSTAALPTGWKAEAIATERTVTTAYTSVAGTATALALANGSAMSGTAGNGIYNFGNGSTTADRTVGGLSSASASKSVNMFLKLTNSSATTSIPSFNVTYDAKRFRNGSNTAGFSIRLYYSTTGAASSWTEITAGALSFTANADNTGSTTNPSETKTATNIALAQSLAASGSIYFAWSYSVTSGTTTSNAQALGIDNITITAVAPSTYTVTYNANSATSGTVPTDSNAYSSNASVTTAANSGTLARTGYSFAGWNTAADGTGTNYAVSTASAFTITANTTLYAKWTANNNTVTFNANTGSGTAMSNQTIATAASATLTSNTYTKAGYAFAGWNTLADGTGTSYANSASYTMGTASVTLYAKWTANNNTITFDANTGSGTAMSNQTIATAASATLTSNTYTKAGYTFAGWNTLADGTGTSYSNGASYTMGTASVTLYAKWTANNNTVTFDANTGSGTAMSNQTIATAASATLSSNTYTKSGYSFAGWATTSSGVVAYANTANYTMGTSSVTLYAKWTANNNTITFDANTGSGTMSSQIIATAASASLSTNTYTKTGYDFGGWTTAADGTGTAYIDGANYIMGTTNVTLYAKWTSVALASQTITFNALSPLVYSTTPLTLTATASSGLEVSYSSDNINVANVSGSTVTLVGVGSANITASQAGNSSYNGAPSVSQTLTVTPKELTIASASVSDKVYDRNTTAVLNGSLSGVINSDAVTLSLSAAFDTATAGIGKSVTSTSTLGGAKVGNYTLTQPTGLTATITAKTLTVNGATVTTRSYTGTTAATITGASLVGVISPDAVGVTGGGTFAQASVGTGIAVTTSLTLNGADASNYSVSQPTGLTGTITTSGLTLNGITGTNKIYDATTVATITGTPAYVGLQNGETFSVTGTPAASFGTKVIGTAKAITISNYTAPSTNYTLTQPTGLTGNITAATLTVTAATAASKVFDGTTTTSTSGGSFLGVLLTDSVNLTHGTANFTSTAVGIGIAVTSAITATGTDGANYSVTQPSLTANITAAPVVLAGWQFGSPASTGSETTYNSTTNNSNLSTSTLSRGAGITATALGRGFAANNFDANATKANAITNNEYFEFSINALSGYNYSLSTLNATLRRSGATAPNAYIWMYSSNGTTFNEIGTDISFTSTADGAVQTAISLTGISALQNAKAITFRLYAWGGTSTSATFSIARYAVNNTTNSLAISGNTFADITPPTLVADSSSNTVDNNNDITFTDDVTWRTKITALKIGTTALTLTTDYVVAAGIITLKPSGGNALLTAAGSKSITIIATGYTNATVTQVINPGIPTANSTATISAILAPNTTRTITCTALDQYSNYVSGYTFKYTATIINSDATNNETYTIDGSQYSATTTQNVSWNGVTAGITTFDATLPSTIDATDGISIQMKLADGTTTIGSPFAYHELPGQTITFNSLSNVTYGDGTYDISATGGASGNPVVFSSSDTSIVTCTGTNGKTITVVGPGTCTIYANQAGNAGYNTAAQASQPLTVDKKALTITAATALDKVYNGNNVATIRGTLSATTVGLDVVTLTLSGTFADVNAGSAIAVTSTSTLGGTNAGKYTLTQPTGLTANITQVATNIINGFGTITNKIIGQTFTLAATSTSGLVVTYSSSNENVATISGNTVTSVGVGVTNITASQAGNGNYVAATSLTQELIVTPVPIAAWDFTGVGNYATIAATTFSSNLVSTSNANTVTRGSAASSSTGANSFRTTGFQNNGISTSNTDYFQVTLAPITGQNVSLSTINSNFAGTTAFYGTPGVTSQYAYSLDGTNFTLIGLPVTSMSLKPAEIDLSGVAALQGVPSGTTITLRYYASGQTTTGGWGFYSATAGTNGLSIGGSVAGTPTTTWDGSVWSDGTPTISKNAVIDAAYSTTDYGVFSANTLTVNNGYTFTINSGHTITVRNAITNNGSFLVENNANLIQTNDVANTGNITLKRDSALLLRLDHTLWSSPVTGIQRLKDFSPGTLQNRFYTYATTSNSYVNVANPTNIDGSNFTNNFTFAAGKGYAIRTPNNHSSTTPTAFSGTFTGVPNNGNVPFTLAVDASSGNNFNLVGNPYPSTIDVAAFLNGNLNVAGTIYFYTHSMTMNAATGLFPQGTNYSSYNSLGSTLSTHINGDLHPDPVVPNGTVQVGQGFFVKSLTGGTVTFTNAMRTGNNVNQFLRTAEIEKHRIWLNLKTDTGTDINQMMVGYTEGATQAVDTDYDGLLFGNTGSSLSSVLNGAYYGIQGRSLPFESNDFVPLSFKASAVGNYTISLTNSDGLFAGSQDIFVRDNLIGTDHNIKVSPYAFASDAGTFDSRFELVYTQALGIPSTNFTPNSVIVYKNTDWFHVNTKGINMKDIQVFDVSGRLIYKLADINATTAVLNGLTKTNEVLFLKITSEDNLTVTVKVIN